MLKSFFFAQNANMKKVSYFVYLSFQLYGSFWKVCLFFYVCIESLDCGSFMMILFQVSIKFPLNNIPFNNFLLKNNGAIIYRLMIDR